jgi:hypothetical protein
VAGWIASIRIFWRTENLAGSCLTGHPRLYSGESRLRRGRRTLPETGNTLANPTDNDSDDNYIELDANNTTATLNISNNTFTDDNVVDPDDVCEILTAIGNIVTNMNEDGFDVDVDLDGGTVNLIADKNNLSNCGEEGLELDTNAAGAILNAAVRNNTITNSSNDSVEVDLEDSGTTCVDFVGNIVTQNVTFDEDGTGTINVEQLAPGDGGPLTILNTFNNGAIVDEQSGTTNSVADGTCVFP